MVRVGEEPLCVQGQPVHRLSLVAGLLLAGIASAQPTPNADNSPDDTGPGGKGPREEPQLDQAWLGKTIASLDSDDIATRDKATANLTSDDRLNLPLLENRLE